MTVATSVTEVIHDKDPKKVIWDDLKDYLPRITHLTSGDIIVCVYERPEKTRGGILVPETASRRSEDKFQGVVGLIVKVGPNYVTEHKKFLGLDEMPKVGDWIAFRNQDCSSFTLGNRSMRMLQGNFIRMVLADPDCII